MQVVTDHVIIVTVIIAFCSIISLLLLPFAFIDNGIG